MKAGFVICGPAGVGKSTVAKELARSEEVFWIEISRDLLPALLANDRPIPSRGAADPEFRVRARDLFNRETDGGTKSWMASHVKALVAAEGSGKYALITGLRGAPDMLALQAEGYRLIYVYAKPATILSRLAMRSSGTIESASEEHDADQAMLAGFDLSRVADVAVDVSDCSVEESVRLVRNAVLANADVVPVRFQLVRPHPYEECSVCLNTSAMPGVLIDATGVCEVCKSYAKSGNLRGSTVELDRIVREIVAFRGKVDAVVGVSGGKDSTATLIAAKTLGLNVSAFTLDLGYYPTHIFSRAAAVCAGLGVDHEVVDVRDHVTSNVRESYLRTADLFESDISIASRMKFLEFYAKGRATYSIKHDLIMPYVRTCQLCRRTVIKAYYRYARQKGVSYVLLGINEWAQLSGSSDGETEFSGLRKLQPSELEAPVFVVHLPFLVGSTLGATTATLAESSWRPPHGELLVESNSNSCLFARAAEFKALQNLGFHPDTTRLSREVTCGFLPKQEARRALDVCHMSPWSVGEVLTSSGII